MPIKAGRIVTQGNGFLVERLQTSGPNSLNIPTEQIYETGNDLGVAILRDIPDLSFDLESFDMSLSTEALLCNIDPGTLVTGDFIDFNQSQPLQVVSPYKSSSLSSFVTVGGVIASYLTLETVAYKFQVKQSSSQTFTLKGDSLYFVPGTPYFDKFTGVGPAYAFTNAALKTVIQGDNIYALDVTLIYADGSNRRLFHGLDYSDTSSGFTITSTEALATLAADTIVHVVYGSSVSTSFPQNVHSTATTLPAAVRGKDVQVYISDGAATPTWTHWPGLQSADVTRKVTLQADQELGNVHNVSQDYDTPDVSGTVSFRPSTSQEMMLWMQKITGAATGDIANPNDAPALGLEIQVNHPDTGARLKTIYVPDARFTAPGPQAKVKAKLDLSIPFASDTGAFHVYKGVGPSGL